MQYLKRPHIIGPGVTQSTIPAGEWTGTMDLGYTSRSAKRRPWVRPLFFLRHRLHSQLVRINGGERMDDMTACPRCGVFVANNGTQCGTITINAKAV